VAHIPSGWGQVNLKWGGTAYPTGAECTFGIAQGSISDPASVASTIAGIIDTRLSDRIPTTVTLESILVKFGPNDTGPFDDFGVGAAGTGSSGDVNPNMAILIRKVTGFGGRIGRGRMYWPVAEDQVAQAGVLKTSPDQVAAMNAAMADFLSDMSDADIALALLHTATTPDPYVITGLSTQPTTATQRRRLRR